MSKKELFEDLLHDLDSLGVLPEEHRDDAEGVSVGTFESPRVSRHSFHEGFDLDQDVHRVGEKAILQLPKEAEAKV